MYLQNFVNVNQSHNTHYKTRTFSNKERKGKQRWEGGRKTREVEKQRKTNLQ